MDALETKIPGVLVLAYKRHQDNRGFFAETWNRQKFADLGIDVDFVQANLSYNKVAGTLRGLHAQTAPHQEDKLVSCVQGAIYDVVVDIRPKSPTYLQWVSVELRADNHSMVFIPKGCLHGFQTLVDETKVHYQVSNYYAPEAAVTYPYNDPAFNIDWPLAVSEISDKDKHAERYSDAQLAPTT